MASANGSPTYANMYAVRTGNQDNQQHLPPNVTNGYVPRPRSQFEDIENPLRGQYSDDRQFIGDLGRLGITGDQRTNHNRGELPQIDEIVHLRTQAKSIGVLNELLEDNRLENKALHELVEAQATILKQNNIDISPSIQEQYSRLCYGSMISDTNWSVELKRPPISQTDGKDQNDEQEHRLKQKDNEIRTLKEELERSHQVLQSSQDEKSREIARLKQQLHHQAEDRQNSDAICRSLSGETETLKVRLHVVVEECQKLSAELSEFKKKRPSGKTTPAMSNTSVSLEDQLEISKRQIEQLDREKGQLAGQLKEVIRMNKRWQKYNVKQEKHIQDLAKINTRRENENKVQEIQIKDYEDMVNRLRNHLQESEERHRHLRVENTMKADRDEKIRKLQKTVIDLEQKLKESQTQEGNLDMEFAEQQFKQFREDFQREHAEKEKLEKDNTRQKRAYAELAELIKDMKVKLERAERENREIKQRELRQNAMFRYQDRHPMRERIELTPHGPPPPAESLGDFPTLPRDVQHDGRPQSSFSPPVSPPQSSSSPPTGEDYPDGGQKSYPEDELLQCPRCLREFPISKHSDFVRHTEYCLDT